MATPASNWRDLITPSSRARAQRVQERLLSRAETEPSKLPADLSPSDMSEISIARSLNPEATLDEILGARPKQARLALHMTGRGVTGHGVAATRFSSFISRIDEALAITARSFAHNERRGSRFIFAAVETGSLSFELQAPDVAAPSPQELAVGIDNSTVDSDAMRTITTTFTASATGTDDALESAVTALPTDARVKLFRAMEQVSKAGWEIDGSLRQHDFAPVALEVTLEATNRLRHALEAKTESVKHIDIEAEISGYRREEGLVWLKPLNGDPRFPAAAGNHEVMRAARRAGAVEGTIVRAQVTIETRAPKTESATLKISRTITDLETLATPGRLPFDLS